MGKHLLTNPLKALFTPTHAVWEEAFGTVEYTIIPHYNKIKNHKITVQRILGKSPEDVQSSWLGIDEDTALVIDGDGNTIKGLGTVYFNRKTQF